MLLNLAINTTILFLVELYAVILHTHVNGMMLLLLLQHTVILMKNKGNMLYTTSLVHWQYNMNE